MGLEMFNPGALRAAGARKDAFAWRPCSLEDSETAIRLQAVRTAKRFGLDLSNAKLVATLVFGEGRA